MFHFLFFFYFAPSPYQLNFWCHFFVWFPTSVCALGVFLFITAIFSIGVANRPNSNDLSYRILVGVIAVLYCVAFFGAIFMIFCAVKLEGSISRENPTPDSVQKVRLIPLFSPTLNTFLAASEAVWQGPHSHR